MSRIRHTRHAAFFGDASCRVPVQPGLWPLSTLAPAILLYALPIQPHENLPSTGACQSFPCWVFESDKHRGDQQCLSTWGCPPICAGQCYPDSGHGSLWREPRAAHTPGFVRPAVKGFSGGGSPRPSLGTGSGTLVGTPWAVSGTEPRHAGGSARGQQPSQPAGASQPRPSHRPSNSAGAAISPSRAGDGTGGTVRGDPCTTSSSGLRGVGGSGQSAGAGHLERTGCLETLVSASARSAICLQGWHPSPASGPGGVATHSVCCRGRTPSCSTPPAGACVLPVTGARTNVDDDCASG